MEALRSSGTTWIRLFEEYMELPRATRKELSRNGAILLRAEDKPLTSRADHEATGKDPSSSWADHNFDPGNFVYSLAMHIMWPHFVQSDHVQYNTETMEDSFAGILGLEFESVQSCLCTQAHALAVQVI